MLIKAEQKYLRVSPQKLRFVAQTIKGVKSPSKAVAYLDLVQKKAADPIVKVLKQAMGNAKNTYGILPQDLIIRELLINEGPNFKRGQPVSRGRFHPILKQMSHVRVILESVEKPKEVVNTKKAESKAGGKSTDHRLQSTAKKAVVSRRKSVVKK